LWNSELTLQHNSQHVADAYSLLHLSIGSFIYMLTQHFNQTLRWTHWAVVGLASAAAWEAVENLPALIALFNPPGLEVYHGDSILNALGDVVFVCAGLALATRLRPGALWAAIAGIELACAVLIQDSILWGTVRIILEN
jgi:hypothetical protein